MLLIIIMDQALAILDYNKDNVINLEDVYDFIIQKMKLVKKTSKNMSGKQKKYIVMSEIEKVYGSIVLNEFKEMISEFIDFYYRRFMNKCFKCL